MFNKFLENRKTKQKDEHEKHLKAALAEKCANLDLEYASHDEDETRYTIVTINGETLRVPKEEITIGSVTEYKVKDCKGEP